MLVLSRYPREEIVIITPEGKEITISVQTIRGDRVRIGCQAGSEVKFYRREVLERMRAEQRSKQKIGG